MLTKAQLKEIDARLQNGTVPENLAQEMGLSYTGFRNALLMSGCKWETVRRLVPTGPAKDTSAADTIQASANA